MTQPMNQPSVPASVAPAMITHPSRFMVRMYPYPGRTMAGKKDYDATKNVPEGEPTQVLPKGTETGMPKRKDVFAALEKVARKPRK